MSTYHLIEPEVAGEIGESTVIDHSTTPPTVSRLEYHFTTWLGDELLEAYPCFIVSQRLQSALQSLGGTGYTFAEVLVTRSQQFEELVDGIQLPQFCWLRLHGRAAVDDAETTKKGCLVVSDRFLNLLREFNIGNCLIRKRPFRRQAPPEIAPEPKSGAP
jgi:hypothetical protein